MPSIIDYPTVLRQLESEGLNCQYYNGGAFGFPEGVRTEIRGWVGPGDETIRDEMRRFVRNVGEPYEENLADWAGRAWGEFLVGKVWVMPASHWSFELSHGNEGWLPGLLRDVGIDSGSLIGLTNAAAIEFGAVENGPFKMFMRGLLGGLTGSDFALAFPGHRMVCMVHHHKQLWWVTADELIARRLDGIQ